MTIFTDTYIPYEYTNKYDALSHLESRCQQMKKSLRLVEKDSEHLRVRCPLSGDYLDVVGTSEDIEWLDKQLRLRNWYRTS